MQVFLFKTFKLHSKSGIKKWQLSVQRTKMTQSENMRNEEVREREHVERQSHGVPPSLATAELCN